MNYEAAMIVMSRPEHFSTQEKFRAAGFIIDVPAPPAHVQTDHDANRQVAHRVRKQAFKDMVDGRF